MRGSFAWLVGVACVVGTCTASLKHPVHGRNQFKRNGHDAFAQQIDNTDAFMDNVVPVSYRQRPEDDVVRTERPHVQAERVSPDNNNGGGGHLHHDQQLGGLGSLFNGWDEEAQHAPRNLQDDWMTWDEAEAAGSVGPMRVKFVTEIWDQGSTRLVANEHCSEVGQVVTPSNVLTAAGISSDSISCDTDDLIDTFKIGLVKQRLGWTEGYVNSTFHVKRAQSAIEITQTQGYTLSQTVYEDVDLVVVMTLHPTSSGGIAGFAYCVQYDQFGRCTVGYFNWVPDGLSSSSTFYFPNVAMSERATALHEVMHILGCCKNSNLFRHEDGTAFDLDEKLVAEQESSAIDKQIVKWITPGVLATAREQWNCSDLDGVPLEDVALGVNAHWEARLLGPEVMSYGIGSGEVYVASITLAFFEDSNQYRVNWTAGTERLYAASGDDQELATTTFDSIFAADDETSVVLPNRTWSPGYLRWGRNAGCPFVQNPPSLENWGSRYFCHVADETACTGDSLESGSCYLLEYGSGTNTAGTEYYTSTTISGGSLSESSVSNTNSPSLPTQYEYLTDYTLQGWGGYSSSMDFAPIRYGFTNCRDEEPTFETALSQESVDFVDASDLFSEISTEVSDTGGQIFSEMSRCFESSLLLYTEVQYLDLEFSTKGLCYLSNCYTDSYLQVGLKTISGSVKWFRCQEAGEVFVSGFIGTFVCPDPAEFCAYEDVSGFKYTENNELLEWIFWGVLLGVLLILFIVFCCCRKARQCVALKLKTMMNFDTTKKGKRDEEKKGKSPGSTLITIVSALWTLVGLGLIVVGLIAIIDTELLWDTASRQVYHFIGLGAVTIILATLGTMTAKDDHPTLKAAVYFYILLFLLITFIFLAIIVFAVPTWLEVMVELAWDTFRAQFPDSWVLYTAEEAWEAMLVLFDTIAIYLYVTLGVIAFSMLGGLVSAFVMLEFQNVIGTMLFWMNVVILVAGVVFIWASSTLAPILPTEKVVGLLIPGCLTVIVGVVGVATCRNTNALVAYMVITALGFVAMLSVGIWLMVTIDDNAALVASLSTQDLSDLVQKLDFFASEWTDVKLQEWLSANLQAAGIAAIILSFVILATIGAAIIVLRSSQRIKKLKSLEDKSKRMDVSGGGREWVIAAQEGRGYSSTEESGIEMSQIQFARKADERV